MRVSVKVFEVFFKSHSACCVLDLVLSTFCKECTCTWICAMSKLVYRVFNLKVDICNHSLQGDFDYKVRTFDNFNARTV